MLETSFLYDLPNLIFCLITVFIVGAWAKLPKNILIILIGHCFVPFFLNDFLFSAMLFGDQFRYTSAVHEIRQDWDLVTQIGNVANASWMLSAIPLPLVETVKSLGFFNKFLLIVTFGFLYKRGVLNNFSAYFFLLYPSVVLYTGLSLRDTLILCYMLIGTYFAVKRNFILVIFWLAPLWFIKFQNLLIMLPIVFYVVFNIGKKGMSPRSGGVFIVCLLAALIASFPIAAPMINEFRLAMYREDGGANIEDVELISGIGSFIYMGLTSGFYFFVKPLPWESAKAFQFIQSLENLFIMYLIFKLTIKAWKNNTRQLMFWLVLFVSSMSIYGLVVFNYGTAARYRFPFVLIYVIFVCYSCNIKNVFDRKSNFK